MASVIKVDQIQSDTGTTQISSNVVSNKTVTGTTDGTIRNIYRGTQGGLYARSVTSNVSAGATESNAAAHIGKADTTGDISVFIGADQGTGSVVSAPCGYIGAISAGLYYPPLVLQPSGSGSVVIQSGQLKFPASQNASSDANTLDDYEEGTWSPRITDNTNSSGVGLGHYRKIGNLVIAQLQLYNADISSITAGNALYISGLPYAQGSSGGSHQLLSTPSNTLYGSLLAHDMNGATTTQLYYSGGTDRVNWSTLTRTAWGGSSVSVYGTYIYRTAN